MRKTEACAGSYTVIILTYATESMILFGVPTTYVLAEK